MNPKMLKVLAREMEQIATDAIELRKYGFGTLDHLIELDRLLGDIEGSARRARELVTRQLNDCEEDDG